VTKSRDTFPTLHLVVVSPKKKKKKRKEKKRNINNDLAVLPSHDTLCNKLLIFLKKKT